MSTRRDSISDPLEVIEADLLARHRKTRADDPLPGYADPRLVKLTLGLALTGLTRNEIKKALSEEVGAAFKDRWVDDWLAPQGPIADAFRDWDPTGAIDAASSIGLFRLIEELGVPAGAAREWLGESDDRPISEVGVAVRIVLYGIMKERQRRTTDSRKRLDRPDHAEDALARRFSLPGVLLLGDGQTRYRAPHAPGPNLRVRYLEQVWSPTTDPLNSRFDDEWFGWALMAIGWDHVGMMEASGDRSVWNGALVRLADITQTADDLTHTLTLQPTTYVAQTATSFLFERWPSLLASLEKEPGRRAVVDRLRTMIERRRRDLTDISRSARRDQGTAGAGARDFQKAQMLERDIVELKSVIARLEDPEFPAEGLVEASKTRRAGLKDAHARRLIEESRLANALSANVAVVSSDNVLFIQRRNKGKVGAGFVDWQTTAAGFLNPDHDLDAAGNPSIWKAMERESREEFGRAVEAPVLGIFWESRSMEVGALALRRSPWPADKIDLPLVEQNEVQAFLRCQFTPEDVFGFACERRFGGMPVQGREGPWSNVMPLGAATMILALVRDAGGGETAWDDLGRDFERVRAR